MTLYLDVSAAVHQRAGIARYALTLTRTLVREYGDQKQFGLFYNGDRGGVPLPDLAHLPKRTVRWSYKPWRMAVWLGQRLGLSFDRLMPDAELFHATEHLLMPLHRARTVLTVHDLIYRLFPAYHRHLNYWFLNMAMPLFVRRADALITPSESSKRDLVREYDVPPEKVTVVYEAASPRFQPVPDAQVEATRARYGLPEHYILALGTIEPRKNLYRLVDALSLLRKTVPELCLVIVGGTGWLYQDFFQNLEKLEDPKAVLMAGYVPDADLPSLITGAAAMVLASLYEGFGLPILEAMACGTPVVCSNTSSMPELGGTAAQYFDPQDVHDMVKAISAVLADSDLRQEMRQRGLAQAALFSRERAAQETMAVYDRLLTNR
jgi:glycosyltransferase involved in cell wall biosynthesis